MTDEEPLEVQKARRVIRAWEQRNGHDSYVHCIDGGYTGYQAMCWDCDWRGPEHLRGDEEMGTPESHRHKNEAHGDSAAHREQTKPADWLDLALTP